MTETMQGRRVEWTSQILAPGEYAKMPDGTWYAATPNGSIGNLRGHEVVEHEDGTITVSPSILVHRSSTQPERDGALLWHGFLERGVWRAC